MGVVSQRIELMQPGEAVLGFGSTSLVQRRSNRRYRARFTTTVAKKLPPFRCAALGMVDPDLSVFRMRLRHGKLLEGAGSMCMQPVG